MTADLDPILRRLADHERIEALAIRLRPRTPMESADLGVRLCQHAARSVFYCYASVAVPVMALAIAGTLATSDQRQLMAP